MANVPEAATEPVVGDLVAAFRQELAYWIPVLLTPVVEELKSLKIQQIDPVKDQGRDKSCISFLPDRSSSLHFGPISTSPRTSAIERSSTVATAAAGGSAVADAIITLPSSYSNPVLEESQQAAFQDAVAVEKKTKNGTPAQLNNSLPMQMEIQMSTPLVDAAGTPPEALFHWSWRKLWGPKSNSAREGYHLTPRCEDAPDSTVYNNLLDTETTYDMEADMEEDEEHHDELTDPAAAKRLPKEIAKKEAEAHTCHEVLEDLDTLWKNRRKPYEEEIVNVHKEIERLHDELEHARAPRHQDGPAPGPRRLRCVDSESFTALCNLVVLLNLSAMLLAPKYPSYAHMFKVADHVFLGWYVIELSLKAVYFQCFLICGKISIVWWNWLDLLIVVSGVVDQWLLPLLAMMNEGELQVDTSSLRALRLLRLFRITRFLKILRAFLKSDFAWTEGWIFESWMAMVIAFNSVVMSMELDIPWMGWLYVENFLQIVYTFELSCRLKRQCCRFFTDMDNMVWNYLDLLMVAGGAADLWMVPLISTIRGLFSGDLSVHRSDTMETLLRLLKIMRILRVLRLVRLLKMVHPLYRLLMGVVASVKAMQWVLVLTMLTLYACAIVFTNLVGKGLLQNGVVSDEADIYFGSVPKSLFSLFKLMNGDMSMVGPITGSITGQLLFAGFMVVSNWAILAVLTAVVSDNMINTSQKANEEDAAKEKLADYNSRCRRLTALFKEIDHGNKGMISTSDWQKLFEDRSLMSELCDASGLQPEDLQEYFDCLAKDPKQQEMDQMRQVGDWTELSLDYQTFMDNLKDEGALADKRSILHVMKEVRLVESQLKREFEELGKFRKSMASMQTSWRHTAQLVTAQNGENAHRDTLTAPVA